MDLHVTPLAEIAPKVAAARAAYDSGSTRPRAWRKATLQRMLAVIDSHEQRLLDALAADFGKHPHEAWLTEVAFVKAEIDFALAHLGEWMAPKRVRTPLSAKPSASYLVPEPVGVVCVIAPWNYPVQLLLAPIVAAVAAGNAVVAKPSELAPHASAAVSRLIEDLDEQAITVVEGGVAETTELLAQRFDHIFYTGNARVARIVARAAAEHLTPTTLELGGKSPAVVSRNANIAVTARRIAWGKFLNAGQTCIAPDYVLVEEPVHDQLVAALAATVKEFYGDDPQASSDFTRIVNSNHFHRLEKLLDSGTVAFGGVADADTRYISPTVLTDVSADDPVMAEEIFGPILPVLKVKSVKEAVDFVAARSTGGDVPLALYSFSDKDAENDMVVEGTSSGGVCVNGTLWHIANPHLPFGGVGESGSGAYHGRFGFDTFTHQRAVHTRSTRLDPALAYPPYTAKKQKVVRKAMTMADPRDRLAKLRNRFRRV